MFDKRIVGGREAKQGEFPFVAHLSYTRDKMPIQCVGTILHDQIILVPAFCVVHQGTEQVIRPDELLIGYGSVERSKLRHARVLEIAVHRKYTHNGIHNNIALVRVEPLEFSETVNRIPVFSGSVSARERMEVMGWGADDQIGAKWSETLKTTDVRIGDSARCQRSENYNGVEGRVLCSDNMLNPGHDLCNGEVGAPLVHDVDGQKQLVGIYSYHIDLSKEGYDLCAKNSSLAYYTHVYSYLDFIASTVGIPVDTFTKSLHEPAGSPAAPKRLGKGAVAGIAAGSAALALLLFAVLVKVWRVHQAQKRTAWGHTYELASRTAEDDEDDEIVAIAPSH
ncbi:Transmembrane protease serine 4 [Linderina pennispora]|nr:Transmembrane protease serine 4 [Linderina pennispora]